MVHACHFAKHSATHYSLRDEVVPSIINHQGTLYQKCHDWLEAAARMMQAWCISGILAHIDDRAYCGDDFMRWMSALMPSLFPRMYVSPSLFPFHPTSDPPTEQLLRKAYALRFLHLEPTEWTLLDISRREPVPAWITPLAPPPFHARTMSSVRLGLSISQVPPRSLLPQPFAAPMHSRHTPSLSAVGGHMPDTQLPWPLSPMMPPNSPSTSAPASAAPSHPSTPFPSHLVGMAGPHTLSHG